MNKKVQALKQFLDSSPTAWHAVASVRERLEQQGFSPLHEEEPWQLTPGGRYFVIRNGSSLCAFVVPKKQLQKTCLIGAHTDSPGFKLKPNAEFRKENMIMLGVEVYGAPLISSWLNRDLGIAGRIIYQTKKGRIEERLVRLDRHPVVLPQLAIHLDREVNEKGIVLNKQEQLAVIAALTTKEDSGSYLERELREQIDFKELLASDLYLFPLEPAAFVGEKEQMLAAYRIDNLNSVHACLSALCELERPQEHTLAMMAIWDNEEIGSATRQGAASPFLSHVLERITLALKLSREEYLRSLSQSFCISVDLVHALHPNYTDKHEPRHPLMMEGGIVIKHNAQNRYATDARSAAKIISLCQQEGIAVQKFVTRGDIPAGSTIGPIHAHVTGMATVDLGCAQLSMHSCRELTSCKDYLDLCRLLKLALNKSDC